MDYKYFIIPILFILAFLIFMIIFHFKKKSVIKKVKALNTYEKDAILDDLAESIGYTYDNCQDLFIARVDAIQKIFGYNSFYDFAAAYVNMIFDYETIYFDYNGRTWLIEMWKGQYGINTGCELGIYYADGIVSPDKYNTTHFTSVEEKDMLDITLNLNRHCPKKHCKYNAFGSVKKKHWWLTLFKMGAFTKPDKLFVNTSITFKDFQMMNSFLESFEKTLPNTTYNINGLTVYFTFFKSNRKYNIFKRMVRSLALTSCRIYCKWFNSITRPFIRSGDKLLYLYYYLPFAIRILFKKKVK